MQAMDAGGTLEERSHDAADSTVHDKAAPATDAPTADGKSGGGGSMRKKLSGKTYHHIKDMFATKFGKSAKNSKSNAVDNNNARWFNIIKFISNNHRYNQLQFNSMIFLSYV